MSTKERRELAKEEYFYLQGAYERFDTAFFQIKSWSVTLGAAGLLAALNLESNQPLAFLVIAAMALTFWYMDITWKTFQRAHLPRLQTLESLLEEDDGAAPVPNIRRSWKATFDAMVDRKAAARYPGVAKFAPNVLVPHVIIFAASLVLAGASCAGFLSPAVADAPTATLSITQK